MSSILVIDDDELVRILVRETLVAEGHDVATAPDGSRGLAMLESTRYDLLVTDIVMPEVDGLETIMTARRIAPDMRIIAMSGGGNWLAPDKCLGMSQKLGAVCALPKPISPDELADTVRRVLAGGD